MRDDVLYEVPPDRFVATRNALVRELREKNDPRVAEVQRLKRPSVSAWLVNALVRTSKAEVEALFSAGDRLQRAQHRVLEGASPDELHEATRAVRDALGKALSRARALLRDEGRRATPDVVRRVSSTLRNAAVDRRVRAIVAEGRLLEDPSDEGDLVEELAASRPPSSETATSTARSKSGGKRTTRAATDEKARARERAEVKARAARERRERAEAKAREAERRRAIAEAKRHVERLRKEAQAEDRAVEIARHALRKAEQRRDRARDALQAAEADLAQL